MLLPKFEHVIPETLVDASRILAEKGPDAKLISGGTDVIVAMKEQHISPAWIVDIKSIAGLDYLEFDPNHGLRIGALATLRKIETSAFVKEKYPAVAKAANYVASTQVRAKATMAGNICNASPSADTAPILIALGAVLTIHDGTASRELPIETFFTGPKKTILKPGEIVTEIRIPPMAKGQSAAYIKHSVRKAMDLAIVGVAASLTVDGDVCKDVRIVLGAVAATPVRAPKAENMLIGNKLTDALIEEASQAASCECTPIDDVRASAEYRQDMVRVFTRRAIRQALGQ